MIIKSIVSNNQYHIIYMFLILIIDLSMKQCCAMPGTGSCAEGYIYTPGASCHWIGAVTSCCTQIAGDVDEDIDGCENYGNSYDSDCTSEYCEESAVKPSSRVCLENGHVDSDCCAMPGTGSCAEGYAYTAGSECHWIGAVTSCCSPIEGYEWEDFDEIMTTDHFIIGLTVLCVISVFATCVLCTIGFFVVKFLRNPYAVQHISPDTSLSHEVNSPMQYPIQMPHSNNGYAVVGTQMEMTPVGLMSSTESNVKDGQPVVWTATSVI